jgi:hypothetical protein
LVIARLVFTVPKPSGWGAKIGLFGSCGQSVRKPAIASRPKPIVIGRFLRRWEKAMAGSTPSSVEASVVKDCPDAAKLAVASGWSEKSSTLNATWLPSNSVSTAGLT